MNFDDFQNTIDLHFFSAADVPGVLDAFIRHCRRKDYTAITIIHGKGRSALKHRVQRLLAGHPDIAVWHSTANWGRTTAMLHPRSTAEKQQQNPVETPPC